MMFGRSIEMHWSIWIFLAIVVSEPDFSSDSLKAVHEIVNVETINAGIESQCKDQGELDVVGELSSQELSIIGPREET